MTDRTVRPGAEPPVPSTDAPHSPHAKHDAYDDTGAPSRKGLALTLIALAQMMVVLDVSVVNVALPSIQGALGFSASNLEWVVNAYALAFGGLLLLGGRIADKYGQRRTFMAGAALLTVASLLGGLAQDQGWLLAARAAQGVSGALIAPAALALLTSTFAEGAERNKAMGVYGAVSGVGGALGNVLGGVFTDELSWRWVLFINVPIGAFVLLTATRAFRESRAAAGRLDLPGALSVTAGMSLIVYGLINAASHSWGSSATIVPLAVGGALLVAFLAIEARSSSPLMPLPIFRDGNRSSAFAIMFAIGSSLIVLFYFLTLFIQIVLGFSPLRTGFAFLTFAVGTAVCATLSSSLVGRVGPGPLLTVGTLVSAGGMFWLSGIDADSGYLGALFGPLLIVGSGIGLCFVPLTLTAVAGVEGEQAGISSALLNASQQVGGALGLAVLGTVAATATRHRMAHLLHSGGTTGGGTAGQRMRHAVSDSLAHGYSVGFLIAGFILVGAAVIAATAIRVSAEDAARADAGVPL
ncbi:MFS transporter [Actinacidiphila rubida]|uniref:Drug resistance transporter, EmrB/QacA subfamily n=1 Tax=Actinacidiphila rubida TaxID=310780 RepID=A0A1H8EFK1_9ACTN|nr:MFS transporter [Actinacidiphila rubida]SEN18186.1 drug resistance transporter, EmrB/QacA subfamily [Actinacidiphila rubida]